MKYTLKLNKLIAFIYFFRAFKSYRLASLFSKYQLSLPATAALQRKGAHLYFTRTGNKIPIGNIQVYERHLKPFITLLNDSRVKAIEDDSAKGVILKIKDVFIYVKSPPNAFI